MSYSDQPSPYGAAALGGVCLVAFLRLTIQFMPGETVIAILMPLASVAVALTLVHLLRNRCDWRAKLCSGVMLGQGLWEGFQVGLEGTPLYPSTIAILAGLCLALALLWRPATWVLWLIMVDGLAGIALNGWAASRAVVPPPGAPGIVVQALLHGASLFLTLSLYQVKRAERVLASLEDELFS